MAIAGKVAITPKGEWNANTAYTKLDLVFYENASYIAIQPSTGVTPTNTAYWMLVVQSAGGADLEAIINGTTPVGNALALDGHGAEYFFPSIGGEINGNVTMKIDDATEALIYELDTPNRKIEVAVLPNGSFGILDSTNDKWIFTSSLEGSNVLDGTATGNLPLTGGTLTGDLSIAKHNNGSTKFIKNHSASADYGTRIYDISADGKQSGFAWSANSKTPYFIDSDGKESDFLHTGNKPTGTYTGNGSATARQIAVGGIGSVVAVYSNNTVALVGFGGFVGMQGGSVVGKTDAYVADGKLYIANTDACLNANGVTYTYQVL